MVSRLTNRLLATFRKRTGFILLDLFPDLRFPFLIVTPAGLGITLIQLAWVVQQWNGVLRIPAAVNAITGVTNAALMTLIVSRCLRMDPPRRVKPIQLVAGVNMLLAIMGLVSCWINGFAVLGWSLNALEIAVTQTLNLVLILWVLRATRLLQRLAR